MASETYIEKDKGPPYAINVSSRKLTLVLLGVISLLLFANLAVVYLRFVMGYEHLRGFINGFYFDAEANFPSLYSALAIFLCAVLLWLIGSTQKEKQRKHSAYWKVLSIFFVFLALDEFGSLHEYLIPPMRAAMKAASLDSGYFFFAWFFPYLVIALLLGLVLLRFLLTLPSETRWRFFLAAVIFLAGAVGMEMVGGNYWASQGWSIDGRDPVDFNYALIVTVEELLEMLGVLIFTHALFRYYLKEGTNPSFVVRVTDRRL